MKAGVSRLHRSLLIVGAVVGVACSGTSPEQANIGLDASRRVPENPPEDPNRPLVDAGTDPIDATTTTPDAAPPPVYDAGPPITLEAGAEYEGGIPCVMGGVLEVEPNDDATSATVMAPTVCGAVLPGTESDFLKFRLQGATRSMYIGFDGKVSLTVTIEGQSVTITPTSAPNVPFVKGKDYFIEVKSLDQSRQNYRVTIFES